MGLIVSCFAAAGSRVSLTGGLYAYIEVAFGPFIGFLAGVLFWLMASFAVASVGSAFAGSMGALLAGGGRTDRPGVDHRGALHISRDGQRARRQDRRRADPNRHGRQAAAARGVRPRGHLVRGSSGAEMARRSKRVGDRADVHHPDLRVRGCRSRAGADRRSRESDAHGPPRGVHRPRDHDDVLPADSDDGAGTARRRRCSTFATAPLAEAASRVLGSFGRALMLLGATVSMFGYASGDMLGTPRLIYAFGRDGLLPEPFARIHAERRTPYVAIAFHAIVVSVLAISSSFAQLAILANVSALTLYGTCVAASIELQRRDVRDASALSGSTPLRLPGGPTIPALAIVVIVWLLSHATRREFGIEAIVLGIATAFYFSRRRGALRVRLVASPAVAPDRRVRNRQRARVRGAIDRVVDDHARVLELADRRPVEPTRAARTSESLPEHLDLAVLEDDERLAAVVGEKLDRAIEPGGIQLVEPERQSSGVHAQGPGMLQGDRDGIPVRAAGDEAGDVDVPPLPAADVEGRSFGRRRHADDAHEQH